jgi:hypothetical protein
MINIHVTEEELAGLTADYTVEEIAAMRAEIRRAYTYLKNIPKPQPDGRRWRSEMLEGNAKARKMWKRIGEHDQTLTKQEIDEALAGFMVGRDIDEMSRDDKQMAIGMLMFASVIKVAL